MSAILNNSVATTGTQSRPGGSSFRALTDAWRWWSSEMRALFQPLVLRYWHDPTGLATLTLPAEGEPKLPTAIAGRDWRVILDRSHVLEKAVTYPAAVEENLADVVLNDLDRQTPFRAEQIYLTHRVLRRFEGADGVMRIEVALTMVLRSRVDAVLEAIRAAGGNVHALVVAGTDIDLLPTSMRRARRWTRLQKMNVVLACLWGALILAVIVVPILQRRAEVRDLAPLVGKAQGEAEATRKIDAEYQRLLTEYQTAQTKKHQSPPVLDIVEELSRVSPDTTWLQSLEMKASSKTKSVREIVITGEAASASKMIELLEQSPLLQNTTQRAQTTRGAQPNTERFQIATELKPRVVPEPVDLLAPPTSAAPAPAPAAPPLASANDAKPVAKVEPKPDSKADLKSDPKTEAKPAPAKASVDSKSGASSAPSQTAPAPSATPNGNAASGAGARPATPVTTPGGAK
jgi:general secretion pathway protein L